MQITLDAERWTVDDDMSLLEILAQVSDKAHAKHRVITSLLLGGHRVTDRDLVPTLLAKTGKDVGDMQVTTHSVGQVLAQADENIRRYAASLKTEGRELLQAMRAGKSHDGALAHWLSRLADYVEISEAIPVQPTGSQCLQPLTPWIVQLLDARAASDAVSVADILDYEVLPRLPE
jgi:hypothetical protein